MKKRGQITLFIILGVLLLIAIALVIIFREEITTFRPERVVPEEVAPLVLYGDNCLEQISDDAMNLLGAQGGYIYLPDEIQNNPLSYVDTGIKTPYWQYINQNRIPSIPLIEGHLSRYIEDHYNDCLQDFEPFQVEYDVVPTGPIEVTATLAERSTIFKVNYNLEIRNKEGTKVSEVSEFQYESPVQLKKVYEVAREIMETEAEENKLERITIDLIALDPDVPLSDFDITCSQKIWQVSDVENKIKTLLRTNLPSLRVEKTSYKPVPSDQPYIKNHYVWQVTDINYPDIKASFQFNENKPFSMEVTPRSGSILRSGQQKSFDVASWLCIQMWKFTYSVEFPVVVTVEDEENNFALNYAFEVKVKRNRPSRDVLGSAPVPFTQYGATTADYCAPENLYGNYIMKIYTSDNISGPLFDEESYPINNVNITFTCLKYTCDMGQTEFQQGGVYAMLETRFPYCVNGIVRGKKPGYQQAEAFVTTALGREVNLYLTPLQIIDTFSVVKHSVTNGVVSQTSQNLGNDEFALITLKYIKNSTLEHETTSNYPNEFGDLLPLELLGGADFTYYLEIFLMNEDNIVGGYQGNWTPNSVQLKNSQEVEFHVVSIGEPTSDQEIINFMLNLPTYSAAPVLQPTIT